MGRGRARRLSSCDTVRPRVPSLALGNMAEEWWLDRGLGKGMGLVWCTCPWWDGL